MTFWLLVWKDMRREGRSKESLQAGLVLVGLFFVLHLFGDSTLAGAAAALALWTPLTFATAALTGRGLATEADRGTLDWLRTAPVPAAWIGWSRTLVDGIMASLLGAVTLLLMALGFALPITGGLVLIVALGVIGLTVAGALVGGLAAQTRGRDILLPILLIPVAAPLLHAGMRATIAELAGRPDATATLLMLGYDLIIVGAAWLLWPHIMEAD